MRGPGWSNAEIAGHLYLEETTVKSHVRSVLTKLGLRDRGLSLAKARGASRARDNAAPKRHPHADGKQAWLGGCHPPPERVESTAALSSQPCDQDLLR